MYVRFTFNVITGGGGGGGGNPFKGVIVGEGEKGWGGR